MKRKLLVLLSTVVLFICVLAISAGADGIKRFETDEFQSGDNITYLEGINEDMYYTDGESISYLCGTNENETEQLSSAYAVKMKNVSKNMKKHTQKTCVLCSLRKIKLRAC